MPTLLTHPVVALALAPAFGRERVSPGLLVLGVACTMVPDLDVIGFRLGVSYADMLGHRGLSHSLAFAAVLALLLALAWRTPRGRTAPLATFLFLFLCTASHGILDAFTDGGLGVAFFAPFANERYFFPWRPIAVSPLGLQRFLDGRAWPVVRSELLWVVTPALVFGALATLLARLRHRARPEVALSGEGDRP